MKPQLSVKRNVHFLIINVILVLGISQPSWAWKLGDPIGKVIEDGGKDIERGVQNLGKAAEDVVTLGEAGRRRDKERAEHDKVIAELQHKQAEQAKHEVIKRLDLQIGYNRNTKYQLQRSLGVLAGIHSTLKSNLRATHLIAETMGTQSLEFSAQKEIITQQYQDLADWIEEIGKIPSDSTQPQTDTVIKIQNGLQVKLAFYVDQLNQLPKAPAGEVETAALDEVLELGFQALDSVEREIQSSRDELKKLESDISALEKSLNELKK